MSYDFYHYLLDGVPAVDGEVDFEYTETKEQLADLFTKALDEEQFKYFANRLMYDAEKDPNYQL